MTMNMNVGTKIKSNQTGEVSTIVEIKVFKNPFSLTETHFIVEPVLADSDGTRYRIAGGFTSLMEFINDGLITVEGKS
jgi:hypothetical protein